MEKIVTKSEGHPLSAKFFAHEYFASDRSFLRTSQSREELLKYCFEVQWHRLNSTQKSVLIRLSRLGANPAREDMLVNSLASHHGKKGAIEALNKLRNLSFLEFSPYDDGKYIALHSLVREWLNSL